MEPSQMLPEEFVEESSFEFMAHAAYHAKDLTCRSRSLAFKLLYNPAHQSDLTMAE